MTATDFTRTFTSIIISWLPLAWRAVHKHGWVAAPVFFLRGKSTWFSSRHTEPRWALWSPRLRPCALILAWEGECVPAGFASPDPMILLHTYFIHPWHWQRLSWTLAASLASLLQPAFQARLDIWGLTHCTDQEPSEREPINRPREVMCRI